MATVKCVRFLRHGKMAALTSNDKSGILVETSVFLQIVTLLHNMTKVAEGCCWDVSVRNTPRKQLVCHLGKWH